MGDSKGLVSGSYHVLLPDGRHQYVIYKDEGFGLVAEVTYKGESIFPENKVPTLLVSAKKPTSEAPVATITSSEPALKKPDTTIKEATKEESNNKVVTIESIKAKPLAPVPIYKNKPVALTEIVTRKPSVSEPATKPSDKLYPFSQPIYRQPATTEVNYKAPVAPAYTTTPAYKTQAYTTTTHKAPIYTTPAYKNPVPAYTTTFYKAPVVYKGPLYTAPVYKEQSKKAPAYIPISPPSYNKATPYVGHVYKGSPYHKMMPVYRGPSYRPLTVRAVVNPAAGYQRPQSYQPQAYKAPVPNQSAYSYSVPTYTKAAKYY